ncbi:MAG TPA: zinc ribbon domain-containing protein [Bacteroidota bacterium]|nr:zinc ribbon domain-containing protein [Bacteroidota bacterium]
MPTYEYRCKLCGYEFDELQSIKAEPLKICPQCQKPALKRLVSGGAGLVFKGNGFYETDYHKSHSSASSSSSKKTGPKPKPKTETKSTSTAKVVDSSAK